MKKVYIVLPVFLLGMFSFYAFAADDSTDSTTVVKSRMDWKISGIYNDSEGKPLCVNESLVITVTNHNTHKPLSQAFVRVFYGLNMTAALYTEYDGVAYFMLNRSGVYKVFIQRSEYQNNKDRTFNVTDCTNPTTTTSSTTSTTTTIATSTTTSLEVPQTTQTTLEAATTTTEFAASVSGNSSTSTTFPVCTSCQANKTNQNILVALAVAMALVVLTWSLLGEKRKKRKKHHGGSKVEEAVSEGHSHGHKGHKKKETEAKRGSKE